MEFVPLGDLEHMARNCLAAGLAALLAYAALAAIEAYLSRANKKRTH